ncbi:hypothetical protein [Bradyrhizobium sp. NAS96.2]|uniref:hypothetical protein n=1 Tax=Bradyrhizobium sp. NAS96.2 TaxID=1680160 RepID=UPI00116127E2|nr:hypothetical protein [Bradyrhizobium sp. NAS96.2]
MEKNSCVRKRQPAEVAAAHAQDELATLRLPTAAAAALPRRAHADPSIFYDYALFDFSAAFILDHVGDFLTPRPELTVSFQDRLSLIVHYISPPQTGQGFKTLLGTSIEGGDKVAGNRSLGDFSPLDLHVIGVRKGS